jgi:hypothetical protein
VKRTSAAKAACIPRLASRRAQVASAKNEDHDETAVKLQYSRQAGRHPLADSEEHDIALDQRSQKRRAKLKDAGFAFESSVRLTSDGSYAARKATSAMTRH